jgi:hypothetical protein
MLRGLERNIGRCSGKGRNGTRDEDAAKDCRHNDNRGRRWVGGRERSEQGVAPASGRNVVVKPVARHA